MKSWQDVKVGRKKRPRSGDRTCQTRRVDDIDSMIGQAPKIVVSWIALYVLSRFLHGQRPTERPIQQGKLKTGIIVKH